MKVLILDRIFLALPEKEWKRFLTNQGELQKELFKWNSCMHIVKYIDKNFERNISPLKHLVLVLTVCEGEATVVVCWSMTQQQREVSLLNGSHWEYSQLMLGLTTTVSWLNITGCIPIISSGKRISII